MLTRIGFNPDAVQAHLAQLESSHLPGQHQALRKKGFQFFQKTPAKVGNGIMLRMLIRRAVTKRHRVIRGLLQLAAGEYACGIAVEQQGEQQRRMMGLFTPATITTLQLTQVQLVNDIDDKTRQMRFGAPRLYRGQKQIKGLSINRLKLVRQGGLALLLGL